MATIDISIQVKGANNISKPILITESITDTTLDGKNFNWDATIVDTDGFVTLPKVGLGTAITKIFVQSTECTLRLNDGAQDLDIPVKDYLVYSVGTTLGTNIVSSGSIQVKTDSTSALTADVTIFGS